MTLEQLERVVAQLRARLHPMAKVLIDCGTTLDESYPIDAITEDRGRVIIRPDWGEEVPGLTEAEEERE